MTWSVGVQHGKAFVQPPTGPPAVTTLRLVSGRNLHPSSFTTPTAGRTWRMRVPFKVGATGLVLTFPAWAAAAAATGDEDAGNTVTIGACYVEYGSSLYPVTFSSATTVTIASGATIASDPVTGLTVTAGTVGYVRTYATTTGRIPNLYGSYIYPDEYSADTNLANATGSLQGGANPSLSQMYGPTNISANVTGGEPEYAVGVVGDSISVGVNDDFSSEVHTGFFQRSLYGGIRPYMIVGLPGEATSDYVARGAKRTPLWAASSDYAIIQYGINDLQQNQTLAQLQASVRQMAASAVAINSALKVYKTTLLPKTTSTDAWTTTTGQTTAALNTVRVAFNAWVRDGMPETGGVAVATGTAGALRAGSAGHPYAGYIEVADLGESARDSGVWKANYTNDGLHPTDSGSYTGNASIAAAISYAPFVNVSTTPPPALANTAAPAITGNPQVGNVLTSSTGSWSVAPDSYTYQWNRAGAAISGATASSYTLVTADIGSVTVTVTAVKAGSTSVAATSAAVTVTDRTPVTPGVGEPTLATTGPRVSLTGAGPTLTPTWTGSETVINVGDNWNTKISAASTGTVFRVKAGVHRRTALGCRPKQGQQFIGEPGAIVSGAIDVGNTGWTLTGGVYSKTDATWPAASDGGTGPGVFLAGYTESHWREDLTIDLAPLLRVAGTTPATRQWAYNSTTKTIYLRDNPAGKSVEVSFDQGTSDNDFMSYGGGERVTLKNLTIRHYPSSNQRAAIDTQGAGGGVGDSTTFPQFTATNGYDYQGNTPEGNTSSTLGGWLIDHCAITLCHSFAVFAGAGTTVSNCDLSTNGQGGAKGSGRNVHYAATKMNANNFTHYDPGVEAGGMKCWNVWALHVEDCEFVGNYGVGLWCDYTWLGHVLEYNRFEDNYVAGIMHEMTEGTEIRYNQFLGNMQKLYQSGNDSGANNPGGQLFIGCTRNAHIHHNYIDTKTTGWGALSIQEQERGQVNPVSQGTGAPGPTGAPFTGKRACCAGLNFEFNAVILRTVNNGTAAQWYAQNSQDYGTYADQPPGKVVGWVKGTHTDYGNPGDYVYTRSWDHNFYHLPASTAADNTDSLLHSASDQAWAPFPFRWDGEYGYQLITGTPEAYSTTNIYNICTSDGRRFGSLAQWRKPVSAAGTSGGGFGMDANSSAVYDQ